MLDTVHPDTVCWTELRNTWNFSFHGGLKTRKRTQRTGSKTPSGMGCLLKFCCACSISRTEFCDFFEGFAWAFGIEEWRGKFGEFSVVSACQEAAGN